MLQAYLDRFKALIDQYAGMRFVIDAQVTFDVRPGSQAYVYGVLRFVDDSSLYFREYLDGTGTDTDKLSYSYHYQDAAGALCFRYDNARHRPVLPFDQHKHSGDADIVGAPAPSLAAVLTEILVYAIGSEVLCRWDVWLYAG